MKSASRRHAARTRLKRYVRAYMDLGPIRIVALAVTTLLLAGCATETAPPQAAKGSGSSIFSQLPRSSLVTREGPVIRHVLAEKIYYYAHSPCCDFPNNLYDDTGNFVCAPDGGFAGRGDGKCPLLREALKQSKGEQVPNPFYKP